MNPQFKVLTNVNESNRRTPVIQNRFRKLTLQSPNKQQNDPNEPNNEINLAAPLKCPTPMSNLPIDKFRNVTIRSPRNRTPKNSQVESITNKLMLSTSSTNVSGQTNCINVETEPFTNPLQLSNTENTKESSKTRKSSDSDLISEMEKLDVSRVSPDLFSQLSSMSEKFSLPPNRVLSNEENIDNISQRISNIQMSDGDSLPDTLPNTASQKLADTQPNTSPSKLDSQPNTPRQKVGECKQKTQRSDTTPNALIVLSSDEEDQDDLLTEESEEDETEDESVEEECVIEISDNSFEVMDDRIPQNTSALNAQVEEISESAAEKLNDFFDNIPKINVPHANNCKNDELVESSINISESIPSSKENLDESNVLKSDASQSLSKSENLFSETGDNENSESFEVNDSSIDQSKNSSGESDKTSAADNGSEDQNEPRNMTSSSSHLNQSATDQQLSVPEVPKKIECNKVKASGKNVVTLDSPVINISAKVKINIRLSGFSSSMNSVDTDGSSDVIDESPKRNGSLLSDVVEESLRQTDSVQSESKSSETEIFIAKCGKAATAGLKMVTNTDHDSEESRGGEDESSVIESSMIYTPRVKLTKKSNGSGSSDSQDSTKAKSIVDNNENCVPTVSAIDMSTEIDEIGEKLLTKIYGETWRTPQLQKKCLSTKRDCLTDVPKRNVSVGFNLFKRDMPSDLNSTPEPSKVMETNCVGSDLQTEANKQINENQQNQSSRILRSTRKVLPKRILDYSSESDESAENTDESFAPLKTSSEESDSSCDSPIKPKKKPKGVVFLDLTMNEVIEDEDHEKPEASAEELEKVAEKYLQSLEGKVSVETPAPTKRKLFTPNYDDQTPFDEIRTPVKTPSTKNKTDIKLKTPIPSYLIPPQFQGGQSRGKHSEPITPSNVQPGKSSVKLSAKKCQIQNSLEVCKFLESLDAELIPVEHCHPDALKFRKNLRQNERNQLVTKLMQIFNEFVFGNRLKTVPVSWSNNLRTTAGYCRYIRKSASRKAATIELSTKVTCKPDRIRDTLIHELCHAAVWIIDGESEHHGKIWKMWAAKANKVLTTLPKITRCHNYDINGRFTYKCTICGLKSQGRKLKQVKDVRCSKCQGPIAVFKNKVDQFGNLTLEPVENPSTFSNYVKQYYKLPKESGSTHAKVMEELSDSFFKLSAKEKAKYKS